jgi:hypothetical protein
MRALLTLGLLTLVACGQPDPVARGKAPDNGGSGSVAGQQGVAGSDGEFGGSSASGGTASAEGGVAASEGGSMSDGGAITSGGASAGAGGVSGGQGGQEPSGGKGGDAQGGIPSGGAGGKAGAGGSAGGPQKPVLTAFDFPHQTATFFYKSEWMEKSRLSMRVFFVGPVPGIPTSASCLLLDVELVNGFADSQAWEPTPAQLSCMQEYLDIQTEYHVTASIDVYWSLNGNSGTAWQRLDTHDTGNTGFSVTGWTIDVGENLMREQSGSEVPAMGEWLSAMTLTVYGHQP